MNIIHCENCRFWQDGYCTLRKKKKPATAQLATRQKSIKKEDKKQCLNSK